MSFDKALLDQLIAAYVALIKSVLDSEDPRRFNHVMSLAGQAAEIDRRSNRPARVEDFDGIEPGGGFALGNALVGNAIGVRGGGDNMELIRTMIGALSNIGANRRSPVAELNELLAARSALNNQNFSTTAVDARITVLQGEIENAVVPADILRGRSLDEGGEGHAGVVGAPDGSGTGGDDEAPGAGA